MERYVAIIITYLFSAVISLSILLAFPTQARAEDRVWVERPPLRYREADAVEAETLTPAPMIKLSLFNQTDPRWGNKILAPSNLDMAHWGCYITSFTMVMSQFAIYKNPGEVLDALVAVNGLNETGLLTYSGVERAFPAVSFYTRIYTTNDPSPNFIKQNILVSIQKIKRLIRLGQPVILAVDRVGHDKIPDHAIVLYDAPDDLTKWRIYDPDGGVDILFTERYGSPLTGLYGYIVLIGSPTSFPDSNALPEEGNTLAKLALARRGINVTLNVREALDSLI